MREVTAIPLGSFVATGNGTTFVVDGPFPGGVMEVLGGAGTVKLDVESDHAVLEPTQLDFTTTTCTREAGTGVAAGSWFADGFVIGQSVAFRKPGGLNNGVTVTITALTATVLTVASGFTAETNVQGYQAFGSSFFEIASLAGSTSRSAIPTAAAAIKSLRARCSAYTSGALLTTLFAPRLGLGVR